MTKRLLLCVLALAMVVSTAAIAGCKKTAVDPTADLAEAAAQEGTVMVYWWAQTEIIEALAEAFEAKYPDVQVEFFAASSSKCYERLLNEERAGTHECDVIILAYDKWFTATQDGILAEYTPPVASEYAPEDVDPTGVTAALHGVVVQVNTNLLPDPATWPKSWKDFADPLPEWQGNLIGSIPRERSSAYQVFACQLENFGEETTKAIWQGIMSCDPMLFTGGTACNEALLRGEGAIHFTAVPAYWFQEDEGYPVRTLFFEDGVVRYVGKVSVVGSAPHPNAARLFMDWFLSVEGQTVQNQVGGYYSAHPDVVHLKEIPDCVNLRFDEAAAGDNRNAYLEMFDAWMAEMGG